MSAKTLSTFFYLQSRYHRSVNLERDLEKPDTVQGYVPTERSTDALQRIFTSLGQRHTHRAWTMTGVYGTGKSAFAHFLVSLCAPRESEVRQAAIAIADRAFVANPDVLQAIENIPDQGLVRAVATGQREPLSWTIARALARGADLFWQGKRKKPDVFQSLTDWRIEAESGDCQVSDQQVLAALKALVASAKTNVLLVIDELGKNLEAAAQQGGTRDLYLLQQIAELQLAGEHQVYFLGLLHQSFGGYSDRLAAIEQSEWVKIQGRFEDLPFTESPSQMTRLIGQAINRSQADPLLYVIHDRAQAWFAALQPVLTENEISAETLAKAYPLHPLTALVLPLLCTRYAQNDRSLFTFLTSNEPHAFSTFLAAETIDSDQVPTLKLHRVYDYFVESVTGLASRMNLQRWAEIQGLIQDAQQRDPDVLQVLKTIGIFNLVTSTGALRATPQLVTLALCDRPDNSQEQQHWQAIITTLQQQGLITHRRQIGELRIWEGSDFNVEAAIYERIQTRSTLAALLAKTRPQKPLVAQRHYSTTGTLRYFEQRYVDSLTPLSTLRSSIDRCDGLIAYWLDSEVPEIPPQTVDGKPLILVSTTQLDLLRIRAQEFHALKAIEQDAPELRTDGVARREVRQRLIEAERLLDETLLQAFDWSAGQNHCWAEGNSIAISHTQAFRSLLSDLCDRVYSQSLILDNELINRRDLTTQGAKARRELIEAMLERSSEERLGLEGYGPEVTMYDSVLRTTGIHRCEAGVWSFFPPHEISGVVTIWQAIERFCLEATEKPQSIGELYQRLEAPPYGVLRGVIPILLAAVLLHYSEEISVYRDGTFIPVLGAEHFELLVKDPARFAVKHIEVAGLRSQVFRELEAILRSSPVQPRAGSRNSTVLGVVKPLVQFRRKLPTYTIQTKRISPEAQAVIQTLQETQEPDALLFSALPQACGLVPIATDSEAEAATARIFRDRLVQCLREIHAAYDALLSHCETLLYRAFGLRNNDDQLRQDLKFRAQYLLGSCLESSLDRFVRATVNDRATDRSWLEALLMIVADKPAESWTETDITRFELNLGDLARRFKHLEALQKEIAASGQGGFMSRRLTVTRPDGGDVNRFVFLNDEQTDTVASIGQEVLEKCPEQLREGLLAWLAEQVLNKPANANLKAEEKHTNQSSS